jgi:hypothetical protein
METSQAKIFKSLSEPAVGSVRVLKDAATKIESVIDDIPLSFPPDGRYFLTLEGRALHVYETSVGIRGFSTRAASAVKGVEVDGDTTTVTVSGLSQVNEIVVHRKPGRASGDAVNLEELTAPVSAMQEFSQLAAKESLSASERVRKIELLKEIQGVFVGAHQRSERARQRRSTPPSRGESRGSTSRSCG